MREYGDSNKYNVLATVISKVKDDQLIPLKIEIKPQEADANNEIVEESQIELTQEMLADRDWKLAQVHRHITEQLKTKGKDTLE